MSTTRRRKQNVSHPDFGGTPPGISSRLSEVADESAAAARAAGEDIFDFEDAETLESADLPLRATDLPAPLTINRDALNDEIPGGYPPRPRPSATSQPVAPVEQSVDAVAPKTDSVSIVSSEDFEAMLERLAGEDEPDGAEDEPGAAEAPLDVRVQEVTAELEDETEMDLGFVEDELEAEGEDDFEFIDEHDLTVEEEDDFTSEGVGEDGPNEVLVASAEDEREGGLSLADNADFWATLESTPDTDDVVAPSLIKGKKAAASKPAAPRFGYRPEPALIDVSAIEHARLYKNTLDPAQIVDPEDEEEAIPLAVDDDEDLHDDKEWRPAVHVAARAGALAGPAALSLISPTRADDANELNHALSAFGGLEPGQKGFIRISLRAYPEFKQESRDWLKARKTGLEAPAQKKLHHRGGSWLKYLLALFWFEANKANPHAFGGRVEPTKPGQRGDVRELTAAKAGAEEAQAWKDAERKVLATPHYEVALRLGVVGKTSSQEQLERVAEEVAAGFDAYTTTHQELVWSASDPYDTAIGCMGLKRAANVMLALSADEVGELARVPDDLTTPHGVQVKRSYFKQMPLANPLLIDDPYDPPKGLIPLGIMNSRSEDAKVFGMRVDELDKHLYYVGATGTGKSEMMKWLVFGVAKADYPLVVIDPHGALGEDLLNMLVVNCPERLNDIIMCDLSDGEFPVALNPLDVRAREDIEPTVHSIMEMLAKQMDLGQSAPRARNLAQQAISALCEANLNIKDPDTKCTLLHVVSFFIDVEFRRLVMELCTNLSVKETFDPEKGPFEVMSEKQQMEFAMPIIRAFQPLGSSESFSAVFSAGENRLDFGQLISDHKIVLVKLAHFSHQKKIGEFVGSLILPWLLSSMDSWGRQRNPETGEEHGSGCRVFIDEAPTLIGPGSSAIELLAGARKWDLGMVTTSQYPSQFDKSVLEALLANTNSKISLKLDPSEATPLAKSIAGVAGKVTNGDISDLPNFHYYANIMLPTEEGAANSGAFSAACLPPINCVLDAEHKELRNFVKARSHDLICNRKEDIADRRQHILEHIKGAIGQILIERADSAEVPAGGEYAISLDPLDPQRNFGGW